MDMRIEVAVRGDLEDWRRRTVRAYLYALKDSVILEAKELQTLLRAEVTGAGLGEGIANAWRVEWHPPGGKLAYEPSAFLFSRAAHIIDNFTRGQTYGPKSATLLAIPIPGSPADDLRVRRGGKRTDAAEAKFGPLKVIRTRSGVTLLVGFGRDNGKGGFRKLATRKHKASGASFTPIGQALVMIPLFYLVRNARLRKRLSWPDIAAREKPQFASRVAARLRTRIEAARRGDVGGLE